MRTIIYSKDGGFYYVKEMVCPHCNWVSTTKFKTKEEAGRGWVSDLMAYGRSEKFISYYRSVLPFTFWKIKEGRKEQVDDDHELIRDYVPCGPHWVSPIKTLSSLGWGYRKEYISTPNAHAL